MQSTNPPFTGKIDIDSSTQHTTIELNGDTANVSVGGGGGKFSGGASPGKSDPVTVGGGSDGSISVLDNLDNTRTLINPGEISLFDEKVNIARTLISPGGIGLYDEHGHQGFSVMSDVSGALPMLLGGNGVSPEVSLFRSDVTTDVVSGLSLPLDPHKSAVDLRASDGSIRAGISGDATHGVDGRILTYSKDGPTIQLTGSTGTVQAGLANVSDGHILVLSKDGLSNISMETSPLYAGIQIGSPGVFGNKATQSEIDLFNTRSVSSDSHNSAITIRSSDASIRVGGTLGNVPSGGIVGGPAADQFPAGVNGLILVLDENGNEKIRLDGASGDILLKGADCAEEFDLAVAQEVDPGAVMVLDELGKLRQSGQAYDRKVAGVVSGAGSFKSGIVLDKRESTTGRSPLALVGKVFCKVDASYSPVEVGDLLTTSDTPGHAMKAVDPSRAFGAVIGKALRSLSRGQALIPILVALQ